MSIPCRDPNGEQQKLRSAISRVGSPSRPSTVRNDILFLEPPQDATPWGLHSVILCPVHAVKCPPVYLLRGAMFQLTRSRSADFFNFNIIQNTAQAVAHVTFGVRPIPEPVELCRGSDVRRFQFKQVMHHFGCLCAEVRSAECRIQKEAAHLSTC
jgi:hypothetical protein